MKRVALLLCLSTFALAQDIDLPHTLSNSSVADADQVMANFNALKDGVNSRVSVDLTNDNVVLGNGLLLNSPDPDYFVWSGQSNVAIGFDALLSNTRGYENTAVGVHALRANTDGRLNTAIGLQALENHTADFNTALGRAAMRFTTLGSGNTALGDAALRGQPGTGSTADMTGNTAVGASALGDIYSGQRNTAVGQGAAGSNTSGTDNVAIGYNSLGGTTTGTRNVAIGAFAGSGSGSYQNTAIGYAALNALTTGASNTAIGVGALSGNTVGNGNIALGEGAGFTFGTNDLNNTIAIGNDAHVDASNKIQLGNTSIESVATSGQLTTGAVTYPRTDGTAGQVLTTDGSGNVIWTADADTLADITCPFRKVLMSNGSGWTCSSNDFVQFTDDLEEQIASLEEQLKAQQEELIAQQEELLAIVQSQQEQIAQLQHMVEHQFAAR